eukprot:scpid4353/ scgid7872/ Trafficking protein particle complex subunit 10; Trafficking protein particle complex subunit TMEM1; Transport protein particle subunit TMEM1
MDLRPNITYWGSVDTAKPLQDRLQTWLPQDAVEFQRSYGRGTRQVKIRPNFVFFQPTLALFEPQGRLPVGLHQIPVLHLFWIGETDINSFIKSGNRDSLIQWLKLLHDNNCPNYVIVVVEEVKKAGKNATIYDKIKSEFCAKQPTRCCSVRVVPGGISSAESPSFTALVVRVRQQIVQALSKLMLRSEDYVRERREQCRTSRWHYSDHFLLQEQLAFLLEMWGCLNESLVQYDELDAILSQFINNTSAGEMQSWLEDICIPAEEFAGVPLGKTTSVKYRELLKSRGASLLDIRNHLFMRQSALLCEMGRGVEVAKRALPFLHATLREIDAMRIDNVPGVTESWVYLSCFQVSNLIDKLLAQSTNDPEQVSLLTLNKARLMHYAQRKLYQLASLAGLTKEKVAEEKRVDVARLITGCIAQADDEESTAPSRLCKALCSSEEFTSHYVELSNMARALFIQQGRHRQASIVCVELAKYFVQFKEYAQAEPLLMEACSGACSSLLPSIMAQNLELLAECWLALGKTQKYLVACSVLASSKTPLSVEKREKYLSLLETASTTSNEEASGPVAKDRADGDVPSVSSGKVSNKLILPGKPLVVIGGITTTTPEVRPRQPITVCMTVVSTATRDLQCPSVTLQMHSLRSVRRFTAAMSNPSVSPRAVASAARHPRRSTIVFDDMHDVSMSGAESASSSPPVMLEDMKDDPMSPDTVRSEHFTRGPEEFEFLFSSQPSDSFKRMPSCSSRDLILSASDVVLRPGANLVELTSQSTIVGHLTAASAQLDLGQVRLAYILSQSRSAMFPSAQTIGSLSSTADSSVLALDVVPAEPSYSIDLQLASGENRLLFAGTKESLLLNVSTADDVIEHFVSLILTPVDGMTICLDETVEARLVCRQTGKEEDVTLKWCESKGRAVVFTMPSLSPHSCLTIPISLDLDRSVMRDAESAAPAGNAPRKAKMLPTVTREVLAILDDSAVEFTERICCSICTALEFSHTAHSTPQGVLLSLSTTSNSSCPLAVEMRVCWCEGEEQLQTFQSEQSVIKTTLLYQGVFASLWTLPKYGKPNAKDISGKVKVLATYTTVVDQGNGAESSRNGPANTASTTTNQMTFFL